MPKSTEYSRDALKTLARIDRKTAGRIIEKVGQLATEPASLSNNVRWLKGGGRLMRLRVGDWRVIYEDGIILEIIRIAPRGSAYD